MDNREEALKGGDSGPAIKPGKSAESLLIELVAAFDPDNMMPQKGSKLTPAQISKLRAWIDQGAEWPGSVSFARPAPLNLSRRLPPIPGSPSSAKNPVNGFMDRYFALEKVSKPSLISDRIFARRVYLDLIGMLPTEEELQQFLRERPRVRREKLVEKLLSDSERYAEHWLTFWNDALRNDYRGTGYIDGGRKQITGWLFSALVENKPFDVFVRELVNPGPRSEGFAKGIVWRGVVNASQVAPMQTAQNISQVFMGVNLKCASCHDSFINDWTLADAYGLANVYSEEPLEMFLCDKPTGQKAPLRFIYPQLGNIHSSTNKKERLSELADVITSRENGRLSRTIVNRLWAALMGRGLVEPVDEMENPAWNPDLLDWLAEDLAAHDYNLKHTLMRITTSEAYQLASVNLSDQKESRFVFKGPAVRRLSAEQFRDAVGVLTGAGYPSPASSEFDLSSVRLNSVEAVEARWIWTGTETNQEKTVWFKTELILSGEPDQAGAVSSAGQGYSLYVNGKKVHGENGQRSVQTINLRPHLKAGTNVLLIEASVAAKPDQKPVQGVLFQASGISGGKPWKTATGTGWKWMAKVPADWNKVDQAGLEWDAVVDLGGYNMAPWNIGTRVDAAVSMLPKLGKIRASMVEADPLMVAMGRPNREQVMTSRPSVTTTLQALELTNGETLNQILKRGAELLVKKNQPEQLISGIYVAALGRPPTADEARMVRSFMGEKPGASEIEDFLWSIVMLPEFQLVY